jgi:glutamine amidotransferase
MVEALTEAVHARGVPFFGICVGMQLMAEVGHEYGRHEGLGWLPGEVSAIEAGTAAIKVPHMGWNELRPSHPAHPVLAELGTDSHVYFVHSYAFRPARAEDVLAWSEHGGPIAAFVGRDNMIGAQFHPEKSQAPGLQLIANFWAWTP